jgi:2-polyprenyl-3-methyl-5-hydroxy-6-metoxy-1,4-benzoquinol methylase
VPEPKPTSYFEQARPELVARLPRRLGSVLDVGCGAGAVGRSIRDRADRLVGIELEPTAAERAREHYDDVHVGAVEDVLPALGESFDTILAYDVLEHLVDPVAVVRGLRGVAAPDALLHVSTPNARHWSLVRDLVFRGTFGYTAWGHRDTTHLRWFTPADLAALLEHEGWIVEASEPPPLTLAGRLAMRLTGGRSAELLAYQWSVRARLVLVEVGGE